MLTLAEYLFSTFSPLFTYIWQPLYFLHVFSSLNYRGFLFNIPRNILIQDLFGGDHHAHAFYSGDQLACSMPIRVFYPQSTSLLLPCITSLLMHCVALQYKSRWVQSALSFSIFSITINTHTTPSV